MIAALTDELGVRGIPGGGGLQRAGLAIRRAENLAVSIALAAMAIVPLAEMALRPSLHVGISGSATIVAHLTMIVGMLGGAIAAREGRLLSLSPLSPFLRGSARSAARFFSGTLAAAVSGALCAGGIRFALQERRLTTELAYGLPLWPVILAIPAGLAVIAVRLSLRAADRRSGRVAAGAAAGALIVVGVWPPIAPQALVLPAVAALVVATILGAPVFVTLGGTAAILFWGQGIPVTAVSISHYEQVTNPALPAIPLFTLAGYLLAEGGASARLIRVFQSLLGWVRGGPVVATVLACAFFTSFTGASGVTILALGGLLMPVLLSAGFPERNALGLLTSAGSLGLLWPPCLPMILYAIIARLPIEEMFLGGLLPGTLLAIMTATWGILQTPGGGTRPKFCWTEARAAAWEAKWELLLPAVALFAIFGGFATAVEASALTVAYAFVVEALVYRDLKIAKDLPRVMSECGLLIGGVLLILGCALGFTNFLVDAQIPDQLLHWVTANIRSPLVFLLALNLLLLVVGCLMDIYSAIVVVVPLITGVGLAFNIDPVHLGIIFLANLELGYLTPPVGMNLFLSSYRFGKPMPEVVRSVLWPLLVLLAGVLLITYVPPLSTFLPQKLR